MIIFEIEKGFINKGAHISYENGDHFDTYEKAKKEFDFVSSQLEKNEYVSLNVLTYENNVLINTQADLCYEIGE